MVVIYDNLLSEKEKDKPCYNNFERATHISLFVSEACLFLFCSVLKCLLKLKEK